MDTIPVDDWPLRQETREEAQAAIAKVREDIRRDKDAALRKQKVDLWCKIGDIVLEVVVKGLVLICAIKYLLS